MNELESLAPGEAASENPTASNLAASSQGLASPVANNPALGEPAASNLTAANPASGDLASGEPIANEPLASNLVCKIAPASGRCPEQPARQAGKTANSAARKVRRLVFALLGFISFGLAAVGVFLLILPTTPFLLFAAACFSRSSKRFDDWLKSTKLYQKHLASFVNNRTMPLKTKISLCAFASTMLVIAFILTPIIYARILIVAALLFKYYYFIFRIKTIKPEKSEPGALKPSSRGSEQS